MRARLAAVVLLALTGALVGACAALAAPKRPPPTLRVAELLLVGFRGTEVEGNDEIRRLVCNVRVGGVILFERNATTGQPRNLVSPEQVAKLTADLQGLARQCARRPLFIAADAEGGQVMRLSTRLGYPPSLSAQRDGTGGRPGRHRGRGAARGRHAARGGNQLEPGAGGRRRRQSAQSRRGHARAHVLGRPAPGRGPRTRLHQGHARRGHLDLAQALPRPRLEPPAIPTWASPT